MKVYRAHTPRWLRWVYADALWSMAPSEQPTVYLTFDDGPVPGVTDRILDLLAEHDVPATFFCIGREIESSPGLFRRILQEGHQAGNHTQTHPKGSAISTEEYLQEVADCDALMDSRLFRPPYGVLRRRQYRRLRSTHTIVMWDVCSADFDSKTTASQCAKNVLGHATDGSIILMHDNAKVGPKTVEYLPEVLEGLTQRGFGFGVIE